MKRTTAILPGLLLCIILLAGCQPTPDNPAVVQKNDGKLEEKLAQSPAAAYRYEAPSHWKEAYTRERLTVEFDADILLPDVDKYPVVKVEPALFTQQRVDELVNYFSGGGKLYKYPAAKTKAEYAAEIVLAKRGEMIDGKYVVTEYSENEVRELERKMREAPDTYQREYTDATLNYERDENGKDKTEYGKNFLCVAVDTGEADGPSISVSNYTPSRGSFTRFSYHKLHELFDITESYYNQEMKNYNEDDGLSDEEKGKCEAIFASIPEWVKNDYLAKAMKVINDLQVKDMALTKTEKVIVQGIFSSKPLKGGYKFGFTRANGGIASYQPDSMNRDLDEEPPAYTIPQMQESLEVTVADGEIISVNWNGLVRVVGTESENVELLPFTQIQERVKNQIYYKKSFTLRNGINLQGITVNVVSAELRMGYMGVKDHPGQALLMPVWVIHGQETYTVPIDRNNPDKGTKTEPGEKVDFTFNAIDGGVMDYALDLSDPVLNAAPEADK